ncbi:transcriptional regulator, AraC family [Chitinophaga sp. CF118]|uniref:AraC family transcriptional regulator n=1 Tax=Chitinophaga sp. CF118 TaxID=1884367 RepID=UPI0008EABA8C|nr:helix-turn-helix domain-containing protein [Chitinophaga sp. CF118]SFD75905.1 transcriptional regulator, AraC family [Chitinophaga sp. CF118]
MTTLAQSPGSQLDMPSFEIHAIEWAEKMEKANDNVPHRHDYFEIVWVKEGAGTCLIDLECMDLTSNHVYCLSPGQLHQFRANNDLRGYVLSFTPDFLLMPEGTPTLISRQKYACSRAIKVSEEMKTEMEDLLLKMMKEYDNFFLLRSEILKGLLKIFLIYLTRQYEPRMADIASPRRVELVNRFFAIVEKKYMEHKMVSDYAEELNISPNHLNEIVKKASGFPASYHIRQRVLLEAKRLAAYSGASMKEIAYSLGFEDIAHFSKFFKNLSGLNFTSYKKTAMKSMEY